MVAGPVLEDKWNCTEEELMFEAEKAQWGRRLLLAKEVGDSTSIQKYGRKAHSTFVFKTEQGNTGILQILKIIKNGGWNRKVKIRYWLLKNPTVKIADEQIIWGKPVNGIVCGVRPIQKSFYSDEIFKYDVLYKNVSDHPITVCTYSDPFYVWTQLKILESHGSTIWRGRHANGLKRPLELSDFVRLAPDQTASVRQKMREHSLAAIALLIPGKTAKFAAKVSISGINRMEKHIPGFAEFCKGHNIEPWTGVIKSGPAAFTVMPKPKVQRGEGVDGLRVRLYSPDGE